MPRSLNRFLKPQPRLDRSRWHHLGARQARLLDRTAARRQKVGALYDYRIFRPKAVDNG